MSFENIDLQFSNICWKSRGYPNYVPKYPTPPLAGPGLGPWGGGGRAFGVTTPFKICLKMSNQWFQNDILSRFQDVNSGLPKSRNIKNHGFSRSRHFKNPGSKEPGFAKGRKMVQVSKPFAKGLPNGWAAHSQGRSWLRISWRHLGRSVILVEAMWTGPTSSRRQTQGRRLPSSIRRQALLVHSLVDKDEIWDVYVHVCMHACVYMYTHIYVCIYTCIYPMADARPRHRTLHPLDPAG